MKKISGGSSRTLKMKSLLLGTMLLTACAQADVPGTRNLNIPAPTYAEERKPGINEKPDSVIYLPLGKDVLVPQAGTGVPLPDEIVGPFELRGETLAGALQLVLAGYDMPIAFQTPLATTRTITVTNMKGPINQVVPQICALADLYCAYDRGVLTVKENEVFTVAIPPIGTDSELMTQVVGALESIVGGEPIIDTGTRTIVYTATSRSAEVAERYFQRMRNGTAMIIYETYIWEVSLNNGNSTGINWRLLDTVGKFNFGIDAAGSVNPLLGNPISIGLPTTGSVNFSTGDVLRFISTYGAVKTVSQPQITVLSGSEARLRVAETQNYVSSISRTTDDNGDDTVSTETDSVDTGFTLEINSSWDNSTVYGAFKILLEENLGIDTFDDNPDAIVQLPRTTEREIETNVRVRPGDSILIAGLVREQDNFDKSGLGIEKPILPVDRSALSENSELVVLLRPRVVAFVSAGDKVLKQDEIAPALDTMVSQQIEPDLPEIMEPAPIVIKEPVAPPKPPVAVEKPVVIAPAPKAEMPKVEMKKPEAAPAPPPVEAPVVEAPVKIIEVAPPEPIAPIIEEAPKMIQPQSSAPLVPPANVGYGAKRPEITPLDPSRSKPIGVMR